MKVKVLILLLVASAVYGGDRLAARPMYAACVDQVAREYATCIFKRKISTHFITARTCARGYDETLSECSLLLLSLIVKNKDKIMIIPGGGDSKRGEQ